jgi:crotonobetaine/carnitine-CoA ligase
MTRTNTPMDLPQDGVSPEAGAPAAGESIAELLEWRAAHQHDLPFVKCSAEWRTFGEIEAAAERLACGVARLGVRKGDRVGVISDNRDELIDLFFACSKLGAIEVSFNTFLKGDFLAYQLIDADLTVVVVDAPGLRALSAVFDRASVRTVVTLDEVDAGSLPGSDVHRFADVANGPQGREPAGVSSSDLQAILYTSGTTGAPKGCMLPHGYFRHVPTQYFLDERIASGDRVFCSYPFFHTSAQVYVLMLALHGPCSLRITTSFSASRFMQQARAEGATRILGVAAMGAAILAQPEKPEDADPGSIRTAFWTPFSESDQLEFERRFNIPTFGEGFGQTECMPICHTTLRGSRKRSSNGLPVSYFDLAILDDDGNEVPRGTVGEIAVRPKLPNVMYRGYWRNPEATLENMQHYWHHTGDYGRQDDDGFVFFVDRKKQAIRRRGENISSLEVEAAIRKHPSIRDVAVHAVSSALAEDDVKAVLILDGDVTVQPEELFEFFRGTLPYFAVPRYVEIRESLPVNALGRVMKHVLREEGVTPATWDLEALGFVITKDERR